MKDPTINIQHETLEMVRQDRHALRCALVRVMAHSDPIPGPGTDEAWNAALALLSEEDKRQVFGS